MENENNSAHFAAIDFEHATRVKGTVCSVGIAIFNKQGIVIDTFYSLVKPPNNEFEILTTRIHKICSEHTIDAPSFREIFPEVKTRLHNRVVVAHGAFHTDKHCLEQAMQLAGIPDQLEIDWVCTQKLCGCSLKIACNVLNIELEHHNALSDAIACGKIFAKYMTEDLPMYEITKLKQEIKKTTYSDLFDKPLKGDIFKPDFVNATNQCNPFFCQKVVISGFTFEEKSTIAKELKLLGADIDSGVTQRTNYLITGPTVGPKKIEKMKENIREGKVARIISREEFDEMKLENGSNTLS